jgi:hypothetical protein
LDRLLQILNSRYGGPLFAVAVLFGVLLVVMSGLVHTFAAPRSKISLLWGGFEYEKGPRAFDSARPADGRAPLRTVATSVTEATRERTLRELRQSSGLSALSVASVDELEAMPVSSWGFVSGLKFDPGTMRLEGVDSSGTPQSVSRLAVTDGDHFEVHKDAHGCLFVVGFVASPDAGKTLATADASRNITLFSRPFGEASHLVIIPQRALIRAATYSFQVNDNEHRKKVEAVLGVPEED